MKKFSENGDKHLGCEQARELLNHLRDYLFLREYSAPKEAVKVQ